MFYSRAGNVDHVSLINLVAKSPELRAVNVFDTSSANHYVEAEDGIAFIPHEINLLDKFAKVLRDVETELEKDKQILNLKRFDFSVLQLVVSSPSHTFLSTINSNTTREQLIKILYGILSRTKE